MIRNALTALALVYIGVLVAQIPVDKSTVGQIVLRESLNAVDWSRAQTNHLVSYAGFGESVVGRTLAKAPARTETLLKPAATAPAPAPVKRTEVEKDAEGLTLQDKQAIRRILE